MKVFASYRPYLYSGERHQAAAINNKVLKDAWAALRAGVCVASLKGECRVLKETTQYTPSCTHKPKQEEPK